LRPLLLHPLSLSRCSSHLVLVRVLSLRSLHVLFLVVVVVVVVVVVSLSLSGNRQRDKYLQPSSRAEILPFIDFHQLSVDEIRDPLHSFANFNEFFYRHLKADARPLAAPLDDHIAVQPADCRLHVFPHVDLAKQLWIKGEQFSIPNLLWSEEEGALYEGGSLVIARLAPQDYHRYHFPVSGIMVCEVITGVGSRVGWLACCLCACS
jgi:phosphatidylserine decarboxylase